MALKTQTSSTGQKHAKGGGGGGGGGYMAKGHNEDWLDPNRRLTTTSL